MLFRSSGSWYSYKEERIGQGRENSKRFLTDNKEMAAEIESKVRLAYGLPPAGEQAAVEPPAAEA